MDSTFRNAVLAEKAGTVCLGVRLQALTVGHLFLLLEQGIAFPEHAGQADFKDVLLAVMICGQKDHRKAKGMIESRFAELWFWLWGVLAGKRSRREATYIFCEYLSEQLSTPATDDLGSGGGELRVPLCWRLLAMLQADFHLSHEEALAMPTARAVVLWAVEADRRGTAKLASERQLVFRSWADAMDRSGFQIPIRNESGTQELRKAEEGNPS